MGIYLPGSGSQWQELPRDGQGQVACVWCGEPVDLALPAVAPPSLQPLLLHVGCAAEMGESLIADAREALLASGGLDWGSRAVALVRYRLMQQESD